MGGKRGRGPKRASSSGITLKAQGKGLVKRTPQSPFDPAASDSVDYVVSEIKAERLAAHAFPPGGGSSSHRNVWAYSPDHLVGHEHDIAAFRERRKLEAAKEEAEAAKKKSERQAEIDLAAEDADGFEESSGGKRRSPCWKYFKILRDDNNGKIAFVKCTLCPAENKAIPFSGNTTNLRTHPSLVHKDEYCRMLGSNLSTATEESNRSTSSKGTVDALVPQVSREKRDELHKLITRWLVRCRRPLTLPQNDTGFREIFDYIFRGQYRPPCYQLVAHHILALSAEGKERLAEKLKVLLEEGIIPSIGGDIWSQGGIAIFGILVYWLDSDFEMHEHLLGAIPFSEVRHTGPELEKAMKEACAEFGIGQYVAGGDVNAAPSVDTVSDFIHATCSDNASNIVSGWTCFDGHECADHTIALTVKTFLEQPGVKKVFMKLRVMTTHFNPLAAS
ncbi:hypothetical protein CYMTET_53612 [Cymbomonas tetramitiformis]|uniref:BED-type domain-containing protein n=1 Tax=Cymbomonas tetramitiformis TaxID=36881 RepID=A0AAE0BHS0_9CHLO|nr:hypothetical protein CYMTET_53612 [Cymbomonas tetramitiformis]